MTTNGYLGSNIKAGVLGALVAFAMANLGLWFISIGMSRYDWLQNYVLNFLLGSVLLGVAIGTLCTVATTSRTMLFLIAFVVVFLSYIGTFLIVPRIDTGLSIDSVQPTQAIILYNGVYIVTGLGLALLLVGLTVIVLRLTRK